MYNAEIDAGNVGLRTVNHHETIVIAFVSTMTFIVRQRFDSHRFIIHGGRRGLEICSPNGRYTSIISLSLKRQLTVECWQETSANRHTHLVKSVHHGIIAYSINHWF